MPGAKSPKPVPKGRKLAAATFAAIGIGALGVSSYYGYRRYEREHPKPLPHVIAPVPKEQEELVRAGMTFVAKNVLDVTPEQGQKLAAIWKHMPRSVDELIDYQTRTDAVLTTSQLEKIRPIRKTFQDQVVDRMLEPARDRFPSADFDKFKDEVKARVDQRVNKP